MSTTGRVNDHNVVTFFLFLDCRHFQYLYATLKTEYPNNSDLNNVHFPRKSMFHTFSEQTKIKRRQNFEEFLRVALTIYPMPLCVEDFLDIIDRCGRSYSHSVQKEDSANSHIDKPLPYLYTSPSKKDKLDRRGKDTSSCAHDHLSSSDGETNAVMHDILSKKGEAKKMTHVLLSTFLVTTVAYVLFIFLGFIDIQGCTFGESNCGLLLFAVPYLLKCVTFLYA